MNQQELKILVVKCQKELEDLGYRFPKYKYSISNRLTRALGKCYYRVNRMTGEVFDLQIKISHDLPFNVGAHTVMHELIHVLDPLSDHGYGFKRIAQEVNRKYGYTISTYANKESSAAIRQVRAEKLARVRSY